MVTHRRHNLNQNTPEWNGYAIDEPRLHVWNVGCLSIAKKRNRVTSFLFNVTLVKKFLIQQIGPPLGYFKFTTPLRNITGVHHTFKNKLLALKK